jgi:ribosome-associated protein
MEDTQTPSSPDSLLLVTETLSIPLSEFTFEYARSGGPGGQNVNKVNSKATLRWTPGESPSLPPATKARLLRSVGTRLTKEGELLVTSQLTRDQGRNVEDCLDKVREIVLTAAKPPKARRASRPTLASKVRRVESKVRRSTTKRLRRKPDAD